MVDNINIDPVEPTAQPTLSVDTGSGTAPISTDTAYSRAAKIRFGLSGVLGNPTHQDLFQQIVSGQEQSVRQRAAAQWSINNSQVHTNKIKEAALEGNVDRLKATAANPPAPVNPDGVMETGFGRSWIASLYDTGVNLGNTDFHDAAKAEPDYVAPIGRLGSDTTAKAEWYNTAQENIHDANEGQSLLGRAWHTAAGFIPFRDELRLRGNVSGSGFFAGGLLGSNLVEQIKRLNNEPWEDFQKDAPRILETLKDDPDLAMQFFTAGRSQLQTDLTNVFSAANVAGFIPALPLRQAGLGAIKSMTESAFKSEFSTKGVIPRERALVPTSNMPTEFPLNTAGTVPVKAAAQESAGDVMSAAATRVEATLEDDLKGKSNPIVRAVEALPRAINVSKDALSADTGSWSREQVLRLQQYFGDSAEKLVTTVTNTMRTMQVNWQIASKATIEAAQNDLKGRFPGWSNRVFEMTDPIYDRVSNTWSMGMNLGDSDGQLFAKEAQAKIAANRLDLKDVEIRRQGAGYYIRLYKNLPQDTDIARGLLTAADKDKTPWGWVNALIGSIRSPEYTMARSEMSRRHVTTYAVGEFRRMLDEESQRISDLSQGNVRVNASGKRIPRVIMKARAWGGALPARQAWQEWKRVLDLSRKLPGPDGVPGTTFDTVGEYERFFVEKIHRTPSIPETEAYFAKKRLDLYDHAFRNMAVYSNKANHGAETINLFGLGEKGIVRSKAFDAIPLKTIPKGGNFQYLYVDGDKVGGTVYDNWGKFSQFHKGDQAVDDLVAQGKLKVYEKWASEHPDLNSYGDIKDQRIRYIIAKNVESKPLSWDQVPRRGGGHFDYDYGHYIKQAILHRTGGDVWYNGDRTIAAVSIRKLGQDAAQVFNQARIHLFRGEEDQAKALIQSKSDIKWDKFRSMFYSDTSEPPMLSLDQPIHLVPKDRTVFDVDQSLAKMTNFRNGMREGSKNQQFQVNYTGERDARGLWAINDAGTKNNPLYQATDAELVDPLLSLNRGLNRIVHSTMMNDYKRYAVHHFIKELEDNNALNSNNAHWIKSAPFAYFNNPEDLISKAAPIEMQRVFMSNWKKIQQYLGQPSAFDAYLHGLEQKLVDVTYSKFGQAYTNVPSWLLNRVTDPVQFMRKMTYHAYMGLFNPAEWLVQNQTWSNIWALSPKNAPGGVAAHMFHRWARFTKDPDILKDIDAKASAMGYGPPGLFTEARQALSQTGFEHVDAEQHAYLNTPMDYHFIKNDMHNFLDAGQFFFKDGVKNVRLGAWYTAFKEYRELHPTGKLNETDIMNILDKADQYHGHMSRASVSQLQHGLASYPLQFLTYQMRLAEMFLGKNIGETVQERMLARGRMIGLYSALYGVPLSVGLTGLPLADYFRKSAIEHGYVVGDKWYSTAFNDGIPSLAVGHLTGQYVNIGGRFGAQGVSVLKEFHSVLAGDESSQEALGAAFNFAIPTMSAFGHLLWAMSNGTAYKPTASQVVDVAKGVTSVRHFVQIAAVARYGQWWNSHEGVEATDVGLLHGAIMALSGTEPQSQADQFLMGQMIKERDNAYKQIMYQYTTNVERGLRAAQDRNDTLADTYFTNAQELMTNYLPPTMWGRAITQAYSNGLTIADKVDFSFYTKNVRPGWESDYLNAYTRKQELKDQGIK